MVDHELGKFFANRDGGCGALPVKSVPRLSAGPFVVSVAMFGMESSGKITLPKTLRICVCVANREVRRTFKYSTEVQHKTQRLRGQEPEHFNAAIKQKPRGQIDTELQETPVPGW